MSAMTGELGRHSGELDRGKGGRGARGPTARRVTHAEADSGDTLPAPKVVGRLGAKSSYSARAHCSALQSMHMAGMAILKGQGHVHLCPGASLDALEWSGARWGATYRNERERRSCHG